MDLLSTPFQLFADDSFTYEYEALIAMFHQSLYTCFAGKTNTEINTKPILL